MRNSAFDPHRFIGEIAALSRSDGQIPDPDKGIGRQCYAFSVEEDRAFDAAEAAARDILRYHTEGKDFAVCRDAIGNLRVTFFGSDRSARSHVMPSHLDSVHNGGKYDGVAGIASALSVLDELARSGRKPRRTYEVVVYRAEESSPRNGVGCLGSAIATGNISAEKLKAIEYRPGTKLSTVFSAARWQEVLALAREGPFNGTHIGSSLELHIEQSSLIADQCCDVGIVVGGIGGACRRKVSCTFAPKVSHDGESFEHIVLDVSGQADHTGGTPPNPGFFRAKDGRLFRKDALVASCYILNRLLSNEFVELVRCAPPVDTGYTSVPARQVVHLVTPRVQARGVLRRVATLSEVAKDKLGAEVSVHAEPYGADRIETVASGFVRRYLNLPLIVSALSCKALAREALEFGTTRATVTDYNLTPGTLDFKLDVREVDHDDCERLKTGITRRVERTLGTEALHHVSEKRSQPVDGKLVEVLRTLARQLKLSFVEMPSEPGHDSDRQAAAGIPVAMLFIRQNDGVSHSPYERMERAHFDAANRLAKAFANVMLM